MRELIHDRTNHPARPTPWRPTVKQDESGNTQDITLKGVVRNGYGFVENLWPAPTRNFQNGAAFPATRFLLNRQARVHPIFGSA